MREPASHAERLTKKRTNTESRKHGQKKGSYCFRKAPGNDCGKENYSSQQAAGSQGRAEFTVTFPAEDSGCALVSCHQRASVTEGKGKGQRWPPLATSLLLIAALTGSEPAWVSVRLHFVLLASFSCWSVSIGNREGRDERRAAGQRLHPHSSKPCLGDAAGGEVPPCAEKLLLSEAGLQKCTGNRTHRSPAGKVSWEFSIRLSEPSSVCALSRSALAGGVMAGGVQESGCGSGLAAPGPALLSPRGAPAGSDTLQTGGGSSRRSRAPLLRVGLAAQKQPAQPQNPAWRPGAKLRDETALPHPAGMFQDNALCLNPCAHGKQNSPWAEGSWLGATSAHFHLGNHGGGAFSTLNRGSRVSAYQVCGRVVGIGRTRTGWWL